MASRPRWHLSRLRGLVRGADRPGPAPLDRDVIDTAIRGLYLGLLGREPDGPGLEHWSTIARERGLDAVAAGLAASEERRGRSEGAALDALVAAAVRAARPLLDDAPLTIVDVGAQDLPTEQHVYAPLADLGLPHNVIGFEPLEHRRAQRLAGASDGPGRLELLPAFIGDGDVHTFHVNDPDATSSLLPLNREVTGRLVDLDGLRTVATEPAPTTTLDAVLEGRPAPDLLKLDIQGFELPALRHGVATLARTQAVHCEVSFVEIYEGQARFSDVETFLRHQDFELIDLLNLCRYPLTGTPHATSRDWLGWADALFLRRLDEHAGWRERLGQSLLALVVYGKPSLAAWLARGLEASPAATYAAALGNRPPPT